MKALLILMLMLSVITDPAKISTINKIKAEAKKAYLSGDFKLAAEKYQYLMDSLDVNEDEVRMNLANSYFNLNDTTSALGHYQTLTQSKGNPIRSKAELQLGVMSNRASKFEEALNHFKQAIKADPSNMDARYNYEMLKKKLEEEKEKQQQQQKQDQNKDQEDKQDQQNKDQQNKDEQKKQDQQKKDDQKKDQENKDKKDGDQREDDQKKQEQQEQKDENEDKDNKEKQDVPQSVKDKLKEMKMSEEKAKMILEAMKNQEIQYLQQNKRKATKPKQKGKPDW